MQIKAQVDALGQGPTTFVNTMTALAEKGVKFVPDILVAGGSGGVFEALAATLLKGLKEKVNIGNIGEVMKPKE